MRSTPKRTPRREAAATDAASVPPCSAKGDTPVGQAPRGGGRASGSEASGASGSTRRACVGAPEVTSVASDSVVLPYGLDGAGGALAERDRRLLDYLAEQAVRTRICPCDASRAKG